MTRVGLVFGGRSVEHQVSIASARAVGAGLEEAGHRVLPLGIARDGCWVPRETAAAALSGALETLPPLGESAAATVRELVEAAPEVVFPVVHGTWGEDGSLQGLCEMLDLPYVGAGVAASAVAMDKIFCKQILDDVGLPVVEYRIVTALDFARDPEACGEAIRELPAPWYVKPARGGSSVGVCRVDGPAGLPTALEDSLRFDDKLVVERGIEGRELECAVLGDRTMEASVVGEIVPGNEFYDYADKYLQDTAGLHAPADLPEAMAERIQELSCRAFEAIGGSGMARVDFLLGSSGDPADLFINEINTLPGFTRISMYPRLWSVSGLDLAGLVDRLVAIALERHTRSRELDVAIGSWIGSVLEEG